MGLVTSSCNKDWSTSRGRWIKPNRHLVSSLRITLTLSFSATILYLISIHTLNINNVYTYVHVYCTAGNFGGLKFGKLIYQLKKYHCVYVHNDLKWYILFSQMTILLCYDLSNYFYL